jgi:hypothetical protein
LLASAGFLDSIVPEPPEHFGVNFDEEKEVTDPWQAKGS